MTPSSAHVNGDRCADLIEDVGQTRISGMRGNGGKSNG
jgi:hypothetical protein